MPREFPPGTIREWQQGTVIKAHDPIPPFSNGWIALHTGAKFDQIGKECDGYGRNILDYKLPINGEKFLDHEIDEFGEKEGGHFFKSDNFKAYEGFYGAGRYAFRNEFSRMFMHNDMALSEQVAEALCEANNSAGGDRYTDKLSFEEKKEIRVRVRKEFKEEGDTITEEKALRLLEIVKRTRAQIEEGLDFKDPEKRKIYEEFKKVADSLSESYELISKKRLEKFEAVDSIEGAFFDNWGVRESCKDYIQKKFDEYVRKYADQISKDSLEEQIQMFGVTMDMEPDEFYKKIYEKAGAQSWDFLEKYVGKEITLKYFGRSLRTKLYRKKEDDTIYFKTESGKELDLIREFNTNSINVKLAPEYDEFGGGFKDLIYLRFMKRYGKSIEGEWTLEHLPAVHNLENLINELPEGHFRTNDHLSLITNQGYNGGTRGAYAWYSSSEKRINLSAACIERSTVWGILKNPTEFKSVMSHEIGHAVDKKLGGSSSYNYKKFVVDCGWTYQSPALKAGMSATGEEKDIPRTGSNGSTTLITDYAAKSPSEAFAEYYSFYNLNKEHFDNFFETHNRDFLKTQSKIIAKSVSSEQSIRQMLPERIMQYRNIEDVRSHLGVYKDVERVLSDKGQEHQIALNSPWKMTLSSEEKRKFQPSTVKMRKDYSIHSMPPIVVVKNGLNRVVIDGGVRVEVAKMNKQLVPCIEISKEQYYKLREKGLNDKDIADCVYTKNSDKHVPKQIAPAVEIKGLVYRDELIPLDVILENYDTIKTMSEICRSKELEKALEEIFEKATIDN